MVPLMVDNNYEHYIQKPLLNAIYADSSVIVFALNPTERAWGQLLETEISLNFFDFILKCVL